MARRCLSVVVVALAALAVACGGSDGDGDAGSIGDAVEVAAGAPAAASGVACDVTRRMLETASDVYLTINAAPAPNQLALAESGLIDELSAWFEVTADGAVVPAPGSPCS